MKLKIKAMEIGPLKVFCYLVWCRRTGEGLLIDPAAPSESLAHSIEQNNLRIRWVVNTHGHADHTAGNDFWSLKTGAQTVIHYRDWDFFSTLEMQQTAMAEGFSPLTRIDRQVQEGDKLTVGDIEFTVLHTPGHTPGAICLYTPGNLFTGDTLFVGAAGRTDLSGGSLPLLIQSIQEKILPLPEATIIWPGHDYGETPNSTLGEEKSYNPFITDFL